VAIKDPVQLFQTVVDRMNAEDWEGVAGLCDPVSLVSFRRGMLQQYTRSEPMATTVEQFMKMSPDMPREVAEYNVKRMQQSTDPEQSLHRDFPNVASAAALRALEPAGFFAEWLFGRSPQRQLREQARRGAISKAKADALFSRPLQQFQYETVGAVADGDRIAHVLYRLKMTPPAGAQADDWLAEVPAEERDFVRETATRGHPHLFLCRKQPDGGWLAVADLQFIGTGMYVSFSEVRNEHHEDQTFDPAPELSP
jgi:hypothetical protein